MKQQQSAFPSKRVLSAISVLSLAALLLSAYVFWTTIRGSNLAGCGEGSSCEEVLQTEWGSVLGIPVSLGAIVVYAAILVTSRRLASKDTLFGWRLLLFLSTLAAGSGLWFLGLQFFLIHSLCYFCLIIHLCGLSILALTLWSISKYKPKKDMKQKEMEPTVSLKRVAVSGVMGLAGAALLAGVQILFKGNILPAEPIRSSESQTQPQDKGESPAVATEQVNKREVSLLNGNVTLQLGEYPIIGSADAPKIMALFLDYTCPACRSFHPRMSQLVNNSGKQLAVVVLPMPLDATCNPMVGQTSYQHRDGCNYWMIALALWHVSQDAFHSWDEYMFQTDYPPPLEESRKFASGLIGAEALQVLINEPQNTDLIRYSVQIFHSPLFTTKYLPTLVTPHKYFPGVPTEEQLQQLMAE